MPVDKLCKSYREVESFRDLPGDVLNHLSLLRALGKADPTKAKWVRVDGWYGIDEAKKEIMERRADVSGRTGKTNF